MADVIRAWDLEYTTNDTGQADKVTLKNKAGLVATAQRATPPVLRYLQVGQTVQQWVDQLEGDQLAAFILRTAPTDGELAVRGLQLYPLDPLQDIAEAATGIRLFDRIDVARGQPVDPEVLQIPAIVTGVRHEATPATGWVTSATTVRAVPYLKSDLWDDDPIHLWDDDPVRYWSY